MDTDDRKLFAASLRQLTETRAGADLDAALVDLGWADAYADEPRLAVSLLFEQQGAVNATSGALAEVIAAAAGIERKPGTAFVLPALGRHDAPGEVGADGLAVDGLVTAASVDADVVVVARTPDGCTAVSVAAANLDLRPVQGMDPALGLAHVKTRRPVPVDGATAGADWTAGVAAGHVALAHELVGTARSMLRLARDHAAEREQFGRTIGSFQAVRHRLSDSLVAVTSAAATAEAAWEAPSPVAAMLAKAVAGRSARIVARHAQQVLAGMGFTQEHPFHRYLRRALVLDGLLGGARQLSAEIGAEVLRTGRVPDLVPL